MSLVNVQVIAGQEGSALVKYSQNLKFPIIKEIVGE